MHACGSVRSPKVGYITGGKIHEQCEDSHSFGPSLWGGLGVAVRYRAWQRSSTCTAGALTIWHFFCHLCARKPHREARSPTRSTQTYTPKACEQLRCPSEACGGGGGTQKIPAYLAWKCAREGTAPEPLPPRNRSCVMCPGRPSDKSDRPASRVPEKH